ncbi:EF-P lysine aminoacylase EpmA [Sandarakinorhabdus sp.]|uniref:EF-P lysine aminoacylase EpmA n=1 Tax=Sandarakinorhabdus sp. TaxID=1916663 RepID=UPI00286D8189|nr:EF-P lysine aminoacylase EpmA [Sandarakinorhabdus sp.]
MPRPFWHADIHADRRPFLIGRGRIKAALQGWFANQGFVAVECGAVQISPGNETHLHGFPVTWRPEGGAEQTLYLHTSPEFAAKKLLAAGEPLIVDFARVWRNGEQGPLHAPEFTMVEWYRAATSETEADWSDVIADTLALARTAQDSGSNGELRWKGRSCDAHAEPEMLTCEQAFARHAGIDLAACLSDRDALAAEVTRIGIDVRADDNWSDLFSRVIVRLEPHLGDGRITFLTHYPVCEAALARPCPADPRWAERFEAYACGVELANGFGELTDAAEQRRRFVADMDEKQRLYGRRYPIDEDFIAALAHMPPASGVALGFDRLALLALGGTDIRQVIWTPFPV